MHKYSSLVQWEVHYLEEISDTCYLTAGSNLVPILEGTAQSPSKLCLLVCYKLCLLPDNQLSWNRSRALGKMPWHSSFPNHNRLPTLHQLVMVNTCAPTTRTD